MEEFFEETLRWLMDKIFFWQSEVDAKPGDLIEISRKGFQDWAVYVGSGYVVHLTLQTRGSIYMNLLAGRVVVKKKLLSVVAGTDPYRVNNKHDSEWTVRSPEEIVSKAEKLVGQTVKYTLFLNSCEHFANSLRYDVALSDQVDPKPGDLIEIFRKGYQLGSLRGFRLHCPSDSAKAVVEKELLSKVAGTDLYRVNNKHDSEWTVQSPEEIVSKAEKLLGQTVKYKLFRKNCEHFSNCLRYNVARSDQVQDKALLATAAALSLLMRSEVFVVVCCLFKHLLNQWPFPGDLIEISRKGFQDWAVYVGSGYVVHLAPSSVFSGDPGSKIFFARRPMVKKELLSDVAGTDHYGINNQHDFKYTVWSTYEIISRAEKLVAEKLVDCEFSSQNCEHFANNLRYEMAGSDQVLLPARKMLTWR